jgi:hypothetical protein
MRRIPTLLALAACAFAPAIARAQSIAAGLPPGAKVEGPGIALGDRLVLHLGVGAELRYDSNVFYSDGGPNSPITSGLALRLTPQFSLATKNAQRAVAPDGTPVSHTVDFRFGAGLDYREWLVANTGVRPPRQLNVDANLHLTLFPNGPVTAEIYDIFLRSWQPPYQTTSDSFDRDMNEAGLRLRIKPGGGRLELQLNYAFGVDFWEVDTLKPYNNFYHHGVLRLLWKFLPKTSVYVQGEVYAYQYRSEVTTTVVGDPNPQVVRPDGYPLRVIAGLNGLLTAKLSFDIWAGYANGFYQSGPSPNTGIGGLSLTWRPYALGSFNLAYRHDIMNSLLGVYADTDNVQASWSQQIWRFLAYIRLAYQNTRYHGITFPAEAGGTTPDQTERTDNGFTLNARVDFYAYKNFVAVSLGYDFNLLRADKDIPFVGAPGTAGVVGADFNKHEVYLGLSVLY